ncbi:MAG: cytochrome c, partial [Chloroflexia bacterium]|nr:cytochrome c [Chloroflexia bacterium]
MQRYLIIGFVALLGLVVGLGVYSSREEVRLSDAQATLRQQAVSDAAVIYVENCAVCHGASGEGLGSIPPLDSEALRTMEYDALFKIIARGLYNTPMAAWHQDEGGIL